ncbi:hypothetical protein GCM10028798_33970 [Humibacter antri]
MTVWDPDDLGLEWQLVQNGFCTAFHRTEILEVTALWLTDRNYRVVWFDAARWTDWDALDDDFAMNLEFPNYYGRNGNALIDCLRDVAELSYGWSPDDQGPVLVLDRFATLYQAEQERSHFVLDVIERTAQLAALFGNRILCLVQCDDPRTEFGQVGGHNIPWSPADGWTLRG